MATNEPPKGLLAGAVLATTAPDAPPTLEQPAITPHDVPADPNYTEPVSLSKLVEVAAQIAQVDDLAARDSNRGAFISVLIERLTQLEQALVPFARLGMSMSNARLCLRAASKDTEPAGGYWINQVTSTHLAPAEQYFYTAIDVFGRARTEQHMTRVFELVQAQLKATSALQGEKEKMLTEGGRVQ